MEHKKENKIEDRQGNIVLKNRSDLSLTGVIEVIRFNEDQINLNTKLGPMIIKGSNLKINKLDVQNGEVTIIGKVDSIVYTGNKKSDDSIISKLFK